MADEVLEGIDPFSFPAYSEARFTQVSDSQHAVTGKNSGSKECLVDWFLSQEASPMKEGGKLSQYVILSNSHFLLL